MLYFFCVPETASRKSKKQKENKYYEARQAQNKIILYYLLWISSVAIKLRLLVVQWLPRRNERHVMQRCNKIADLFWINLMLLQWKAKCGAISIFM